MGALNQLLDDFAFLTEWEDRYRHLIELGRTLPPLSDAERHPAHKVEGCMSQVWFVADAQPDGRYIFRADSDAHIVKGLIAILLMAYSGKTAAEIAGVDIESIFKQLGLEQHLSPNRRNGFFSMVGRIRALAQVQ
jgi:cysteine desulfuration protein SufE